MAVTCYYCEHESEHVRYVTFYDAHAEHDEPLCDSCYAEWLESLKG